MAIYIERPNEIGRQASELHNITTEGGMLLTTFADLIAKLKQNWEGTDAHKNITDLAMVYQDVTALVKDMRRIIASVNNNEVTALINHIILSGGTCTRADVLDPAGLAADDTISVQAVGEGEASRTTNEIEAIAAEFDSFPNRFSEFTDKLSTSAATLLGNWKDGANRESIEKVFTTFNNNKGDYVKQIEIVRDNLNQVVVYKKQVGL